MYRIIIVYDPLRQLCLLCDRGADHCGPGPDVHVHDQPGQTMNDECDKVVSVPEAC